jgi:hypothetical protein
MSAALRESPSRVLALGRRGAHRPSNFNPSAGASSRRGVPSRRPLCGSALATKAGAGGRSGRAGSGFVGQAARAGRVTGAGSWRPLDLGWRGYPESLEQAKGVPGAPSWRSARRLEILTGSAAHAVPSGHPDLSIHQVGPQPTRPGAQEYFGFSASEQTLSNASTREVGGCPFTIRSPIPS